VMKSGNCRLNEDHSLEANSFLANLRAKDMGDAAPPDLKS
jgi:hypothetical protein